MSSKSFLAALAVAVSSTGLYAALPKYVNPTPGEFPILGWYSVPDSASTPERYREMREAGFNLSFSHHHTNDEVARALKAAEGSGVGLVITSYALASDTRQTVEMFKDHPQTAVWFLRDEPTVPAFGELAEFRDRVYAADSSHMVYLNLLPIMVEPKSLGSKDYDDYVQRFLDAVRLPMVSYDMYPVVEDEATGRVVVRPQLYGNLESARRVSAANDCPFWAFCLSTAHTPYPVPRDPHMRLEAFAALAYGAQCIQYFTYWQPVTTTWNFHHAPIDATGRRTDVYYMVRDLNREIQALAPIFLGCEVYDVSHTGAEIPDGTKRLEAMPRPFTGTVSASGCGVLVSYLKGGNGKEYVMVVNRDIDNAQRIDAPFRGKLRLVNPDGTMRQASASECVRPGGYLLYCLK